LGEYSLSAAILYGLVISLVTMLVRLAWVYPGAYLPRMCSRRIREREVNPGGKLVFIVGWSGMRGVVSLASALAIPLTLAGGEAFPHRNLILFITFIVILVTLILQGLSLPFVIRWLRIEVKENEEEQRLSLRLRLANAALDYITAEYPGESASIDAFTRLKARYERMIEITNKRLEQEEGEEAAPTFLPRYRQLLLELVRIQRQELSHMRRDNLYSEELLRNKETELDLEEARFNR
jgi:CPA1 family monovalent cation:H+ antiporter